MEEIQKKKEKSIITFCVAILFAVIGYVAQKGISQIALIVTEEAAENYPREDVSFGWAFINLIGFGVFFLFMAIAIILMIVALTKFFIALSDEHEKKKEENKE